MKLYTLYNQFIEETISCPVNFTGIVEYFDGTKYWFLNGKYHRVDGPSNEWSNGTKYWYVNGKLHRIDGPAVEWPDGEKLWWVNNIEVTKQEHELLYSIMKLKGLL